VVTFSATLCDAGAVIVGGAADSSKRSSRVSAALPQLLGRPGPFAYRPR
jgi:hypothetical protein